MKRYGLLMLLLAVTSAGVLAQTAKPETAAAEAPRLVSFSVSDEKVSKATDEIVKQGKVRILLEKTAEVKITANLENVSVDEALSIICKAGDLAWRKIYIKADSALLKNPETQARIKHMLDTGKPLRN